MKLKQDLSDFVKKKGYLLAVKDAIVDGARDGLNITAAIARREYINNVQNTFTTRGTFTKRSIQFDKASGNDLSTMQSEAGALKRADYLRKHEEGEDKVSDKGQNVAIPTTEARSCNFAQKVDKAYYIKNLRKNMVRGGFKKNFNSRKARNVARMAVAYREQKLFLHGNSIFRVDRFSAQGNKVKAWTRLIYTLKRKARITKKPVFENALKKPVADSPNIIKSQIIKQIKKSGLVGNIQIT